MTEPTIEELQEKINSLENSLIEQDHRLLSNLFRFLERKEKYPDEGDPRRLASLKALLLSLLFSPATVAAGGGLIATLSLLVLIWQTSVMSETNTLLREELLKDKETKILIQSVTGTEVTPNHDGLQRSGLKIVGYLLPSGRFDEILNRNGSVVHVVSANTVERCVLKISLGEDNEDDTSVEPKSLISAGKPIPITMVVEPYATSLGRNETAKFQNVIDVLAEIESVDPTGVKLALLQFSINITKLNGESRFGAIVIPVAFYSELPLNFRPDQFGNQLEGPIVSEFSVLDINRIPGMSISKEDFKRKAQLVVLPDPFLPVGFR